MDTIKQRCLALRSKLGPKIVQLTTTVSSSAAQALAPDKLSKKAEVELALESKQLTNKEDAALLGMTLKGAVTLWKEWDGLADDVTFLNEDKLKCVVLYTCFVYHLIIMIKE